MNKEEAKDQLVLQFRFDEDLVALTYVKEKIISTSKFLEFISEKIDKNSTIGVVGREFINYDIYKRILEMSSEIIDMSESFKAVRLIKTAYEEDMIRSACVLTEEALQSRKMSGSRNG